MIGYALPSSAGYRGRVRDPDARNGSLELWRLQRHRRVPGLQEKPHQGLQHLLR